MRKPFATDNRAADSARSLALVLAATAMLGLAPLAQAQTDVATDVFKSEIEAVLNAPTGGSDRQIKVVDIGKLNVAVGVLHMEARPNTGGPISGIAHTQVTEVYYVISGSGTLITGGPIANPRPLAADSEIVEVAVGPSVFGTFEGGERRVVAEGDVVVIPAGLLHGWVEIPDHVTYLSIRPDPDRVLPAGYVNPVIAP